MCRFSSHPFTYLLRSSHAFFIGPPFLVIAFPFLGYLKTEILQAASASFLSAFIFPGLVATGNAELRPLFDARCLRPRSYTTLYLCRPLPWSRSLLLFFATGDRLLAVDRRAVLGLFRTSRFLRNTTAIFFQRPAVLWGPSEDPTSLCYRGFPALLLSYGQLNHSVLVGTGLFSLPPASVPLRGMTRGCSREVPPSVPACPQFGDPPPSFLA